MGSLFAETLRGEANSPVYTLFDTDKDGLPSLYRLYMEMADPTEYQFATTYLHDWKHWVALSGQDWFKPYVERWRTELELKIKGQALRRMMDDVKAPGRDGQAAAKFLLEKGWGDKATKGRPSKEDIRDAADRIAKHAERLDEDAQRLGIVDGSIIR